MRKCLLHGGAQHERTDSLEQVGSLHYPNSGTDHKLWTKKPAAKKGKDEESARDEDIEPGGQVVVVDGLAVGSYCCGGCSG
jgi:hypothetical protein